MSQSILESNVNTYQIKFEKELLSVAYDYNIKKRFGIGNDIDHQKINYLRIVNRAICRQSSELKKYIEDKILGKLEECNIEVEEKGIRHLKKYCDSSEDACGFNGCELRIQW